MPRQWRSGLRGARAELYRRLTATPNGSRPATDAGTVRRCENFNGMLHAKIAYSAGVMAAALLGGIALGGYTTGGFKEREPADVIAQAATHVPTGGFRAEAVEPQAPVYHVCKGCDAKLYREDDWYSTEAIYDTDDEWAREERESRDVVRAALADGSDDPVDREPIPAADDFPLDQDVTVQPGMTVARLDD